MTVPATTRKAGPYTGTGAVSNYPFSFKIFATTDVQVTVADTSGVETTLSSGFSVAMNADQSASPGGSITLSSPLTIDFKLTILGNLPYDQTLSLPGGGNFDPNVIGNTFDRTVMQVQQIAERDSRSVTNAATSSGVSNVLPGPVALMLLGWDALATKIINYAGIASAAVSTFMNATGFLAATTLAQARAAIGALGAADNIATATYGSGIVATTAMTFQQTAAPTGWTKVTTHNDKALRVVSGTASSGGSVAFTTAFASQNVGNTTLDTTQIPSHTHPVPVNGGAGASGTLATTDGTGGAFSTAATGGGGSHTHTLNIAVQYVDLILATKD